MALLKAYSMTSAVNALNVTLSIMVKVAKYASINGYAVSLEKV
jgi:hypothetical protein